MKLKKAIILPAIMLAAALLFAGAGTAKAETLDLKKTISLKVNPGPASMTELTADNVTVAVYKVADAKEDGAGGIAFTASSGVTFSKPVDTYEAMQALDNAAWQTLAQDAAKVVLGESSPIKAEADMTKLSSGLYLVVAYGTSSGLVTGTDANGNLTTSAVIGDYTYSWLPSLVALPTTVAEMGPDGETPNTSTGDWQYSITATLKPSAVENADEFGDLYITKVLPIYESTSEVTFVFSIVATVEGQEEPVYDDVCSLTFDSNGQKTYRILDKIPVGAKVTVTEVYAGTRYQVDGTAVQTVTMNPGNNGVLEVTFRNRYLPIHHHGNGILNEFSYDNGWHLTQN